MVIRISALLLACCVLGSPAWSEDGVVIEEAIYGDFEKSATTDVTEIVANQVKEGAVRLEAENSLLSDPAKGSSKKLQVRYRFQGETSELTIDEGETLLLPPPKLEGDVKILEALYGVFPVGEKYSVLRDVSAKLQDGKLEIEVSNDMFGDPAPGEFKKLRVVYSIGDVKLTKSVYEGGTLKIAGPNAEGQ
jgi:hypothetical protein